MKIGLMKETVGVPILASLAMVLVKIVLPENENMGWQFICMGICAAVYFIVVLLFPEERKTITRLKI